MVHTHTSNDLASRAAKLRQALVNAPELSLPQLVSLLTVAIMPGISVNDLAEENGFSQQTASRYVAVLSGRYQGIDQAEARDPLIVQSINEADPRKRALHLAEAGEELLSQLLSALAAPERSL